MSTSRSDEEPTFFDLEREKLIGLVSENLGHLISGVNTLNRKIEGSVAVGSQFGGVANLWKQYERVMAHSGDDKAQAAQIKTEKVSSPQDVTLADDSFGLAPGAGSTSYMH